METDPATLADGRAIHVLRATLLDRSLVRSLQGLAVVVLFALLGLATDANWPKVARVSLAAFGYGGVLLLFRRIGVARGGWFAAAGGCAGLVSALVRPEFDATIVPAQILGGALFGIVHWLALRRHAASRM